MSTLLVIRLLDNRIEYGRSLLAIEELRGKLLLLAPGARDGSLLSRVRRVISAESSTSDVSLIDRWPAALLSLACIGAIVVALAGWNLAANEAGVRSQNPVKVTLPADTADTQQHSEWGSTSNGLRARVVPVLSSMSEDVIDPATRVARFETGDDVAFVVELNNVSDGPISLLDTRYGDGYGASKGKANSDWFGQFLFSIELFRADGRKIERPEVQIVDLDIPLSSVLVVSLEPGETHRFLLRPARWQNPLALRIEDGNYRAVVRYHGLPSRVAARIKEYRSDSVVLSAVEGDVVTPEVAFAISPTDESPDDSAVSDIVWGEPVDGLRGAMEFHPRQGSYAHGEKPDTKLHVQNVSDKPITLSSHLWLSELPATVRNEQGTAIEVNSVWYSGWTLSARVVLKPQQVVSYDAGNIGFAISKEHAERFEHITHRTLVAPAGKYSMQLEAQFGRGGQLTDGKGKVLSPLDGCSPADHHRGSRSLSARCRCAKKCF